MTPADELRARAQSYFEDSRRFAAMPQATSLAGGMDHEQWAVIYRTVSSELYKCAEVVAKAACDHDWAEYWDGSLGYTATDQCTRCLDYRPTPVAP